MLLDSSAILQPKIHSRFNNNKKKSRERIERSKRDYPREFFPQILIRTLRIPKTISYDYNLLYVRGRSLSSRRHLNRSLEVHCTDGPSKSSTYFGQFCTQKSFHVHSAIIFCPRLIKINKKHFDNCVDNYL